MSFLKKVNVFRRKFTKLLTKNIGSHADISKAELSDKTEIKRVLITRPNHRLGNQLLITPLVQEVSETFPQCKIDLFVKGNVAPILFENYQCVDKIIRLPKKHFKKIGRYIAGWISIKSRKYDIVINAAKGSSSGRLSTKFARAKFKFFGDNAEDFQKRHDDCKHIAKYPVYSFRSYLRQMGVDCNKKSIPPINIKLRSEELKEAQKIVHSLVDAHKKTICLFTYATGAKCYPDYRWLSFYEKLKNRYSEYNILEVLPVENISKIAYKAPVFYSKDLREIASVIANTAVFIGADSGMMHLASASQTLVVGLFSVTNPEVYEPYCNKSLGLKTEELTPEKIFAEIDNILFSTPKKESNEI